MTRSRTNDYMVIAVTIACLQRVNHRQFMKQQSNHLPGSTQYQLPCTNSPVSTLHVPTLPVPTPSVPSPHVPTPPVYN